MTFLKRKIPISALIITVATASLLTGALALVPNVYTNFNNFAALNGQAILVTGQLQVLSFNLTIASSNFTLQCPTCAGSQAHPANFTTFTFFPNDGVSLIPSAEAGTNATAGDFLARYIISTTSLTPSNKLFKVTLAANLSPTCGSATNTVCLFPTFYVHTPTSTTPNLDVLIFFDLGPLDPLPSALLLKISPA